MYIQVATIHLHTCTHTRWPSLACVGLHWLSSTVVGLHGCRGLVLAFVYIKNQTYLGLETHTSRAPSILVVISLRWSSMVFVGQRWLSLVFIGLRWLSVVVTVHKKLNVPGARDAYAYRAPSILVPRS